MNQKIIELHQTQEDHLNGENFRFCDFSERCLLFSIGMLSDECGYDDQRKCSHAIKFYCRGKK